MKFFTALALTLLLPVALAGWKKKKLFTHNPNAPKTYHGYRPMQGYGLGTHHRQGVLPATPNFMDKEGSAAYKKGRNAAPAKKATGLRKALFWRKGTEQKIGYDNIVDEYEMNPQKVINSPKHIKEAKKLAADLARAKYGKTPKGRVKQYLSKKKDEADPERLFQRAGAYKRWVKTNELYDLGMKEKAKAKNGEGWQAEADAQLAAGRVNSGKASLAVGNEKGGAVREQSGKPLLPHLKGSQGGNVSAATAHDIVQNHKELETRMEEMMMV